MMKKRFPYYALGGVFDKTLHAMDSTEKFRFVCEQAEPIKEDIRYLQIQLAGGQITAEDYQARSQELKKKGPCMFWLLQPTQELAPATINLMSDDLTYSPFGIYDDDNITDVGAFIDQTLKPRMRLLKDCLPFVQRSIRDKIHLVFIRPEINGNPVGHLEAIKWLWFQLGQPETRPDESNTDMRRRLFASVKEDMVYINFDGIFNPQPRQITTQELDEAIRAYDAKFPPRKSQRAQTQTAARPVEKEQPSGGVNLEIFLDNLADDDHEEQLRVARELIEKTMADNGITVDSLRKQGGRHTAMLELLSTSVHRMMEKPVFNEVIAELTPDYAKDPDCIRLIEDAYQWKTAPLPYQLRKTLHEIRSNSAAIDLTTTPPPQDAIAPANPRPVKTTLRHNYEEEFAELIKDNKKSLPMAFRMVARYLPKQAYAAGIGGLSCAFGSLLPQVKCRDLSGYLQPARLLMFIVSVSGGGKSAIRRLIDIIMAPRLADGEKSRLAYEAWKMAKKLKGANKDMAAPPKDLRYIWPCDTSCARRLQLAEAAEKGDIIPFTWEDELAGTMLSMRSQGRWNDYSGFLLKAWSGESYSVERSGEDSVSGMVKSASLNVVGGAQDLLIEPLMRNHLWDGLANRFCYLPINTSKWAPTQEIVEFRQADIDLLTQIAIDCTQWPAMELKMPKCLAALRELELLWLKEGEACDDPIIAHPGVRSRALANALRIGQVIFALWLMEGTIKAEPANLVSLVTLYADFLLDNYRLYLGDAHVKAYSKTPDLDAVISATASAQTENDRIFEELAPIFNANDLKAKKKNVTPSAIRMLLARWQAKGLITKQANGTFQKKQ